MNAWMNADTVGTSTDPITAMSAFVEAISVAIGVKSVTSAGNTFDDTVLTPACWRMFCATGICGWVKGSLVVAYAAVLGRSPEGSEAIHSENVTRLSLTGTETSNTLWRPEPNTAGPPPAPS